MPSAGSVTDSLYAGSDLANAAARSAVSHSHSDTVRGALNAAAVLGDALRHRLTGGAQTGWQLATARVVAPGGSADCSIVYAGTGTNRTFCLTGLLGSTDEATIRKFESRDALRQALAAVDPPNVIITDGIDATHPRGADGPFMVMPTWIKQRVRVLPDWHAQLAVMRRGTRQEIARLLRKYGYACRLTRDVAEIERFYAELYVPWVGTRFGDGAVLVERDRCLVEGRRGVLLQLLHEEKVVSAALLRRTAGTMAVVWSALDPRAGQAPGATDVMDYFSLLYAHRKRCRWLDLGPSRPDLMDGILRYKSKWGAGITGGRIPQGSIRLGFAGGNEATRRLLSGRAFIVRSGRDLAALGFTDGVCEEAARRVTDALQAPGIERRRLVAWRPLSLAAREHANAAETIEVLETENMRTAFTL